MKCAVNKKDEMKLLSLFGVSMWISNNEPKTPSFSRSVTTPNDLKFAHKQRCLKREIVFEYPTEAVFLKKKTDRNFVLHYLAKFFSIFCAEIIYFFSSGGFESQQDTSFSIELA